MAERADDAAPEADTRIAPDWRRVRRLARFSSVAVLALLLLAALYFAVLVPVLIACFVAYLLLPLVDRLERWRLPRVVSVGAIVAGFVTVLGVAGVRLVPMLYQQIVSLVQLIPRAINTVTQTWLPSIERYVVDLGVMTVEEAHQLVGGVSILHRAEAQLQAGMSGLWRTGTSVANGLVYGVLIPVVAFFLLKDYRRISAAFWELVPRDLVAPVEGIMARVNRTLRTVLKGQATVAGILTVLYVIGLSIVGLKSAIVIGVVAGICRVIPYLDVLVGAVLSTIVILSDFQGWGQALSVALVFFAVQMIDGAFITPAVLGERVGLHPVIVILSVLAFASWLGFWGVLLAIPLVAIAKELVLAAIPYYRASRAWQAPPEESP